MYLLQQGTGSGTVLAIVRKKTLPWDSFAPRLNNNHSPVVSRAWIFFLLNKRGVSLMIEGSVVGGGGSRNICELTLCQVGLVNEGRQHMAILQIEVVMRSEYVCGNNRGEYRPILLRIGTKI